MFPTEAICEMVPLTRNYRDLGPMRRVWLPSTGARQRPFSAASLPFSAPLRPFSAGLGAPSRDDDAMVSARAPKTAMAACDGEPLRRGRLGRNARQHPARRIPGASLISESIRRARCGDPRRIAPSRRWFRISGTNSESATTEQAVGTASTAPVR